MWEVDGVAAIGDSTFSCPRRRVGGAWMQVSSDARHGMTRYCCG